MFVLRIWKWSKSWHLEVLVGCYWNQCWYRWSFTPVAGCVWNGLRPVFYQKTQRRITSEDAANVSFLSPLCHGQLWQSPCERRCWRCSGGDVKVLIWCAGEKSINLHGKKVFTYLGSFPSCVSLCVWEHHVFVLKNRPFLLAQVRLRSGSVIPASPQLGRTSPAVVKGLLRHKLRLKVAFK